MPGQTDREIPALLLFGAAWLAATAQLIRMTWHDLPIKLFDTDDAMRLVEVRAFLAGQGWFDLHEARLAPPIGYDSHWSRLIDTGLAGLFWLFSTVTEPALAELLMRAVWPLLWLGAALAAMMAVAWRLAGAPGVLAASILSMLGLPAFIQFRLGRIDHHNVQITLALLTLAAVVWSDRKPLTAVAAGLLTALGLAIGLESLPFLAVCGAALAARFVFDRAAGRALALYGGALAVGSVAAFLVSVGPDRWGVMVCDALAANLAVPVAGASVLLALLGAAGRRLPGWSRLLAVVLTGAGAVTAVIALEPRCLGGPFAMVEPAARMAWLDRVEENLSLFELARADLVAAVQFSAVLPVAAIAAAMLALAPAHRRDFALLATVATFLAGAVLALATVKLCFYAMWFALPLLAVLATRIWFALRLSSPLSRVLVVFLLSPSVIAVGGIAAVSAAVPRGNDTGTGQLCNINDDYRLLASLPPGLVVTDIDSGPFVLALTPHSVLGAPYHRVSTAIMETFRIFKLPPEAARAELTRIGATYVAVCTRQQAPADAPPTLASVLTADTTPPWLDRIPGNEGKFLVFRVAPGADGGPASHPPADRP